VDFTLLQRYDGEIAASPRRDGVSPTEPSVSAPTNPAASACPAVTAELFTIPLDGAYLVYAPLRRAAFVANAATVNRIADMSDPATDFSDPETQALLEFLGRLEIVNAGPEPSPVIRFSGPPKPTVVTLFLTTSCNLRCTYCYASAGDTPRHVMPLEVAQRGIDFVIANAVELGRPEIEIAYHGGGEPTLNWETLTGSYAYAREQCDQRQLALRAAMASNGVLARHKVDWIIEHLDGVSLSFDGLPEVNDTHRLTLAGGSSSQDVLATLARFDQARFNYAVRMTVTHDQIPRMAESVEFLVTRFSPRRIQIEPAYQLGRWQDAPTAETQAFIDGFRAAQEVARRHGQEIHFSAARAGLLSNHFCGVTQDSFALTAEGNVSACYEIFLERLPRAERFIYGAVDKQQGGFEFNLPVLNQLRDQTVDRHGFCCGCFAKWSCGGDCYHKSLAVNGDGEFAGSDRCHIIRELTKDQILDSIQAAGGLFWHERAEAGSETQGKEILR
jgi:uncharacterized protein